MSEPEGATAWTDPVVEEVRAARAALLKENGGTLEGIFRELRRAQEQEKGRTVVRTPKPHAEAR